MKHVHTDQLHWHSVGQTYDAFWKSRAKQELSKIELRFIASYLAQTPKKRVLDIGIGSGRIMRSYAADPDIREIFGIDWAASMVDYCRREFGSTKQIRKLQTCNISRERIPFAEKFDFISAVRVLKYNENWQEIIGKIIGHLDNNGLAVFTIPNTHSFLRFTKPETSIYSATKKQLETVIPRQGGNLVRITGFVKLPDVFYDVSDNPLYVGAILSLEGFLRLLLGDILFSRIFFVVVRKRL